METTRKLQRIGGSVALMIPADIARELGLVAGSEVSVVSAEEGFFVSRSTSRPRSEVVDFMARFMDEYDADLRSLADR